MRDRGGRRADDLADAAPSADGRAHVARSARAGRPRPRRRDPPAARQRGELALGLFGEELGLGVLGRVDDRRRHRARPRWRTPGARASRRPSRSPAACARRGLWVGRLGGARIIGRSTRATALAASQHQQSDGECPDESDNHSRLHPALEPVNSGFATACKHPQCIVSTDGG